MPNARESADGIHHQPQAANIGLIRPPIIYLLSIALGIGLHLAWPLSLIGPRLGIPLGAITMGGAIALFVGAVRALGAAGTPVPGNEPTTVIVQTGPFRYTRNPIYLAFSLFHLGIALCVNTAWLLVTLIPAFLLMSFVVIPREETYLTTHFPTDYPVYKRAVHRWL